MDALTLNATLTYAGRVYRVRCFSPMGVNPRRVLLEDVETGAITETPVDDLEPELRQSAQSPEGASETGGDGSLQQQRAARPGPAP